jgi:hypothetical protein
MAPDAEPQSYATHVRKLPRPFLAVGAILALHIVVTTARLVMQPSFITAWNLVVALALGGLAWYARINALVVQDRVIRLEERLRLERLLPDDLKPRIGELSVAQLAALRFAGDAELAGLVRQIVDENLSDRDTIKRRIRDWRPDHLRV